MPNHLRNEFAVMLKSDVASGFVPDGSLMTVAHKGRRYILKRPLLPNFT